ncbi:MAG TPA: MBL fold metallo-hydrolase [Thermoanaerobaculia bacterium]|nr:MBL fold metallo-hydrolase [Thermoanaerobaculia bacterium]
MNFPPQWIHGSPDCGRDDNPAFQVHRLDDATYAIRQNKCWSFEAPFLYLLFGGREALLLDSGAEPDDGRPSPIREVVESILAERGAEGLHLRVAHTHGHGDHVFGDPLLAARPGTEVVGTDLKSVRTAFGIDGWPDGIGAIGLGDRRLTVFPIPGHEPTHVAFYDEATRTVFSGDLLYPGLLTIRDWPAYRASAARLAAFARAHPVSYVLGCHIEMRREAGRLYPLGTTYQPDEHVLQMGPEHIEELHAVCDGLGDAPKTEVRADFIVQPVA